MTLDEVAGHDDNLFQVSELQEKCSEKSWEA